MTESFLILVALWCGNPVSSYHTDGDVNRCRDKAMRCYEKGKEQLKCISEIRF